MNQEVVNHPAHYTECSIECIEAMEIAFGQEALKHFCLCNAFKYLWRHKHKNNDVDLDKAEWYLNAAKKIIYYSQQEEPLRKYINKYKKEQNL